MRKALIVITTILIGIIATAITFLETALTTLMLYTQITCVTGDFPLIAGAVISGITAIAFIFTIVLIRKVRR